MGQAFSCCLGIHLLPNCGGRNHPLVTHRGRFMSALVPKIRFRLSLKKKPESSMQALFTQYSLLSYDIPGPFRACLSLCWVKRTYRSALHSIPRPLSWVPAFCYTLHQRVALWQRAGPSLSEGGFAALSRNQGRRSCKVFPGRCC